MLQYLPEISVYLTSLLVALSRRTASIGVHMHTPGVVADITMAGTSQFEVMKQIIESVS